MHSPFLAMHRSYVYFKVTTKGEKGDDDADGISITKVLFVAG